METRSQLFLYCSDCYCSEKEEDFATEWDKDLTTDERVALLAKTFDNKADSDDEEDCSEDNRCGDCPQCAKIKPCSCGCGYIGGSCEKGLAIDNGEDDEMFDLTADLKRCDVSDIYGGHFECDEELDELQMRKWAFLETLEKKSNTTLSILLLELSETYDRRTGRRLAPDDDDE